jgi:hypothetical protein
VRGIAGMLVTLRKRWGHTSMRQTLGVLLVFSLAGLSILPTRRLLFDFMGIGIDTPTGIKALLWVLILFPIYQLFLLMYGALIGQFHFFWEKEKRLWRWLARPFRRGA